MYEEEKYPYQVVSFVDVNKTDEKKGKTLLYELKDLFVYDETEIAKSPYDDDVTIIKLTKDFTALDDSIDFLIEQAEFLKEHTDWANSVYAILKINSEQDAKEKLNHNIEFSLTKNEKYETTITAFVEKKSNAYHDMLPQEALLFKRERNVDLTYRHF
ncbi:MAG: hypothetical protein QW575_08705 [Thermoproteota archaeon]